MRARNAVLTAALVAGASLPIRAASLDEKQPFICATLEIFECETGLECERESVESVDMPQFLRVSLEEKRVLATRPSGEPVNAPIELVQQSGERIHLHGVINKFGWSMNISTSTGKMTLVGTDDVSGYVVFGACTSH